MIDCGLDLPGRSVAARGLATAQEVIAGGAREPDAGGSAKSWGPQPSQWSGR